MEEWRTVSQKKNTQAMVIVILDGMPFNYTTEEFLARLMFD